MTEPETIPFSGEVLAIKSRTTGMVWIDDDAEHEERDGGIEGIAIDVRSNTG